MTALIADDLAGDWIADHAEEGIAQLEERLRAELVMDEIDALLGRA